MKNVTHYRRKTLMAEKIEKFLNVGLYAIIGGNNLRKYYFKYMNADEKFMLNDYKNRIIDDIMCHE